MELRHLRYFVMLADELHFGRAAGRLHIAQPALSAQIRQLEDEIQVRLFHRTKRHVELTEAGAAFLPEARRILTDTERAVYAARRASRGEIGRLSVGFMPWVDFTSLPQTVRVFGVRHPDVDLELHSLPTSEQVPALLDGRIDVSFLRPPVEDAALLTETILSEPILAIFSKGHRLEAYRRVPLRALHGEPFILFPRHRAPALYDLLARLCHDAGFTLRVKYEADQPHAVLSFVAAGVGISLVPASLQAVRRPGVVYRPLSPSGPRLDLVIAWRRDNQSPVLAEFLRVVRETARRRSKAKASA